MGIFNPTQANLISKMTVGSVTYYLKDAEVRELLLTLNNAAQKSVAVDGVAAGEEGLVTGAQVQAAINKVSGGLQYVGRFNSIEAAETSGTTFKNGDIILVGTKEHIYYEGEWSELGDEGIYVLKSTTIAGLPLDANISVSALQNALELGGLAYKNEATGTVSAQTISGVKATGTTAGSIVVALDQNDTAATLTKVAYTPEGTVSGNVTAKGSVSLAATEATDAFQVSGVVSAPDVTVTPAKADVQAIKTVGTQATFTEGTFSAGSLPTYEQGAKATWSASVDENETLSFSFTANGDDKFSQGTLPSKENDTFVTNELPTKEAINVVTGIESATASAPNFTGGKIAATFAGTSANISATFAGTEQANALVTGVTYKQAAVNAEDTKFTGAAVELAVGNIEVAAKEVTVK